MGLKVCVLGYYGFGNAGDEAVLDGILTGLNVAAKKKGIELKITVLSADPETTRKSRSVNAVNRTSIKLIFSVLRNTDAFILGGGSLLQDVTGRGLSVPYYAGLSILAKILGKKVVFYAQGIGPVKKYANRLIVHIAASLADFLSVRDNGSLLELRGLGVSRKTVHLTADPAFALLADADSQSLREALKKLPDKPILGVMLRNWPGIEDALDKMGTVCDALAKELDLAIALIPMQKIQDLEICRKLHDILDTDSFIIDDDLPPAEMIALYERFSLVLGMRLHALIFAAIAGVPMLGIGYDPKINAFLAQMGMPLSSDTASVSATLLAEQGFKLWNDREIIRGRLLEKAKELRDEAFGFADTVVEALMGEK